MSSVNDQFAARVGQVNAPHIDGLKKGDDKAPVHEAPVVEATEPVKPAKKAAAKKAAKKTAAKK